MATGRRVRAEEAAELLAQWASSGERMSTWCAARGLNWYSLCAFKGWLCTRSGAERLADVEFAEVVVDERVESGMGPGARYRVEVGEVVVEVDDRFRDATLRRLLRVVGAC